MLYDLEFFGAKNSSTLLGVDVQKNDRFSQYSERQTRSGSGRFIDIFGAKSQIFENSSGFSARIFSKVEDEKKNVGHEKLLIFHNEFSKNAKSARAAEKSCRRMYIISAWKRAGISRNPLGGSGKQQANIDLSFVRYPQSSLLKGAT